MALPTELSALATIDPDAASSLVRTALRDARSQAGAAKRLGIARRTLSRLIDRLGLSSELRALGVVAGGSYTDKRKAGLRNQVRARCEQFAPNCACRSVEKP